MHFLTPYQSEFSEDAADVFNRFQETFSALIGKHLEVFIDGLEDKIITGVNILYTDNGPLMRYISNGDGGTGMVHSGRNLLGMDGIEFCFENGHSLIVGNGVDKIQLTSERLSDQKFIPIDPAFPMGILGLIRDFQQTQKTVVDIFEKEYGTRELTTVWIHGVIPKKGALPGIRHYYFHGLGLYAELPDRIIDFDFGKDHRADGFDAWRLSAFAQSLAVPAYSGFEETQNVKVFLDSLHRSGIIDKSGDLASGNFYLKK